MQSKQVSEVFKHLGTTENGLSEVAATQRLAQTGANRLSEKKRKPAIVRFLLQFKDTMVLVLIAAALISLGIALIKGEEGAFTDTAIILAIVVLNALIGFIQESKAEKALNSLKSFSLPHSKVVRGGVVKRVKSEELVVGDIVVLEAGDNVPADLRIIEAHSLKIQESALTGESLPAEKSSRAVAADAALGDRSSMAYSSGAVVYGRGKGVVTATGMNTEIGRVARMLEDKQPPSPLQKKLNKTGRFISIAVIIIAVIIFVAGLFNTSGISGNLFAESLMRAIAIAVAAIPEGLPAVTTIIMAFGVQALSRRRAIIKNLPAVETLGCTEVICSDKTGTLTLNKMTVTRVFMLGENGRGNERKFAENSKNSRESCNTLLQRYRLHCCMAVCNDAILTDTDGKTTTMGDPTEAALLSYLFAEKKDDFLRFKDYKRVGELPFDSVRKRMSVVVEGGGERAVYTKGAVDELLSLCTKILDGGQERTITAEDKRRILAENHSMAAGALRVLGFAFKQSGGSVNSQQYPLKTDFSHTDLAFANGKTTGSGISSGMGGLENGLTFIGLAGMIDPPRPEVKDAVRTCKKAGMNAVMITGDHRDTAAAIARELEIITDDSQVMTGKELDALSDKQYQKIIHKIRVYARVSPENKVRIVKAWQKRGKVVAMTGDGVNDAPSLKAADIGVGMGITGTDLTKGVADMVLADDNFATIIVAVREGRKVFANIQKAMQFLLSANIAEVLSLFVLTVFFRNIAFLLPIHLLWINLVTDSVPALALGTERAEEDIMDYPPRKSDSSMFKGRLGINILYQGVLQTAIVLFIFFFARARFSPQVATTMALVSLCFIQLFHAYNARSERHSIFSVGVFSNFLMNIAFVAGAGLTYMIVAIPQLGEVFRTVPLTLQQWVLAISVSAAIIPLVEIIKLVPAVFGSKQKTESKKLVW